MGISDELVYISPDEYAWIEQYQDHLRDWLSEHETDSDEWWMVVTVYAGAMDAMLDWLKASESELSPTLEMIRVKSCAMEAQSLAGKTPEGI